MRSRAPKPAMPVASLRQRRPHRIFAFQPTVIGPHEVPRRIQIGRQRLDRITVLFPRIEAALQRPDVVDHLLALHLRDQTLGRGLVRAYAIEPERQS